MRVYPRTTFLATTASLLTVCGALGAAPAAGPVRVTIDGTPVGFDQPPIERAGRVFVPLRGVFEKLGASVVYERGHINATKGPTTVSLTVGSTSALVDGRQAYLDNPPFVVGARVLVPLRFVSQALGTTVNFLAASRTVAISVGGVPRRLLDTRVGGLMNLFPADNAAAPAHFGQITGAFTRDIDPKTAHAMLDGNDITPEIFATSHTFVYYVTAPLSPGKHTMRIDAKGADGETVSGSWSFSTG